MFIGCNIGNLYTLPIQLFEAERGRDLNLNRGIYSSKISTLGDYFYDLGKICKHLTSKAGFFQCL